jgi:pilus biogenesis lipoprotein CpaD
MTGSAYSPRHVRPGAWVTVCAIALGLSLQACADRPNLPPADFASGTANPIQISRTQLAHEVSFSAAASEPEAAQMSALFAFIAASGIGPKDTVLIEHGGELIAQAHAQTLAARLSSIGLHPSVVSSANVPAGVARVVVERYVAIAPDCPDWSNKPSPNYQNYNQRNFGCADAANLAAMVADPKDLAMGATMGPQVGDPVTKPIYDYRAGEPGGTAVDFIFGVGATSKEAPASSPRGSSSSGGGAAAGSGAAASATGP